MDQVWAGWATRDGARFRRRLMRHQARSQHAAETPAPERHQTPEWLRRSFVLPLTDADPSDVASGGPGDVPRQGVPHHDDDPPLDPPPAPPTARAPFVRPPSDQVDFALVVHRADLCRTAGRLAWAGTGLAGLALIVFLLTSGAVALGATVLLALAALAAFTIRVRITRTPVPRLRR